MFSNVDSLRTDYYLILLEDQDMTEIQNTLLKLEERIEKLEIYLNQVFN